MKQRRHIITLRGIVELEMPVEIVPLIGEKRTTVRITATGETLTPQEQRVLKCILEYKSNKEIASEMHKSVSTVKFYVSRILAKFGAAKRMELVGKA